MCCVLCYWILSSIVKGVDVSVFSSLQTLAEKYEEAKGESSERIASVGVTRSAFELANAFIEALPLLEVAVKVLEDVVDYYDAGTLTPRIIVRSRAALVSLTGEPR